jgi:integrase
MTAAVNDQPGLRVRAVEYLAMRRALGFKLSAQGRVLMGFVDYAEQRGASTVTTDLAVAWAMDTPRSTDQLWWARRLMVVRIFARHLAAADPATEIPPDDVLVGHHRRTTPYLYSDQQVRGLIAAAHQLAPPLRGQTYATVIGLLAVTGLRIGEAARLDHGDVDLGSGVLTIRDSKFAKSRAVPVHLTTAEALRRYAIARDRLRPTRTCAAFFVSTRGTRLDPANTCHTFAGLLELAGITAHPGSRRPRVHDLRHTFTVNTLLGWYRPEFDGDPAAMLPALSTYLGHVDPKSTYWYLQATPQLLARAAQRLETSPAQPHGGGDRS